jgi:hypothetical protein
VGELVVPVAASVSAQKTIDADDQPSRDIFNATRRLLSLPGGAHLQKPTCREAPAHPTRALREGSGTGLLALLLGSKLHRRYLGRTGPSPFSMPASKMLSGAPVEII